VCVAAFVAAGCHHNNLDSGFGIAWVTLTDTPGDFTAYVVTVDSITLTGVANGVITAVATPEVVDFTKLSDISELWSSASVPNDTYTSATITLDYTTANIAVMVNGAPQKATVLGPTGAAVTTVSTVVNFDPVNRMVVVPTLSSSSAQRLAIDFNLPASNVVNLATNPATVTVNPFFTVSTSSPDTKPIRVRGPLINSSVNVGTYTVYVRPFFDEVDSLGSLTIFNDANTIYQLNGSTYTGSPGLSALSQTSAGTTMTAAYVNFVPTATLNPAVTAGKFNAYYVVGGSTLEDFYTQGLEGDVIARSGNTLTLRGATLQLNDGTSVYLETPDSVLLVGPSTIVTSEDNTALTGLNYNSIAVGQHVIARGIYELPASGVTTLDATGSSATNTGSVRLISTHIVGALVSTAADSLALNLQTIQNWPVSIFNFAGNGASAAQDSIPSSYVVNTGSLTIPAAAAGDPLWVTGITAPFGSAPPDFLASSVNAESAVAASLQVTWGAGGTITPFAALSSTGLSIDLANANYAAGFIRIGSESIDLTSLPASPQIVPAVPPAATPGLPAVYLPLFAVGNPAATTGISVFNNFSTFATTLTTSIVAASPAVTFVANGLYDRTSNTFTASSIDVVN
jgi:hypothetical protein